ncbi:amidohydrolase family protein [Pseudonocardia eucalypti]|uniref:Amidohydrolase family protein n=1 Tax=Pseudonocardia eucalypti TaxID=648755 RepID=A0ABP9RET0_9PSEU|nr:putative TIM-barrel fold metal-dependent hydrolase [Pseudonocardia eucalypti]
MPRQSGELIDVHHHAVPREYLRALADIGVTVSVPGVPFPAWEPADSLAVMEAAGIRAAALSITAPGVAGATGADAERIARVANQSLAEVVREHPGRFGAFALLPLPDVPAALREAEHALDELGLDGLGFYSNAQGLYLGDPELEPLMALLAERGVPAFVHPAQPVALGRPGHLPASVLEFPVETTRAVANLLFSGTLDRHPGLKLIFTHAGGTVPFLANRLANAAVIDPGLADRPPADTMASLRRLHYDVAMSATSSQLRMLHDVVGAERIVFGSDFPFMPFAEAVGTAEGLREYPGFTDEQRRMVAHGTAGGLLYRLAEVAAR